MNFPPGIRSKTAKTDRLSMRYIESGPESGIPVILVHGNLSTGRFFEHVMPAAPTGYRLIAPDMRGFGDTERKAIDAGSSGVLLTGFGGNRFTCFSAFRARPS